MLMPKQLAQQLNTIDHDISLALVSAKTCACQQDPAAFSTELQNTF
jgi:hypothetical protein